MWKYFREMMSDEKTGPGAGSLSRFMKMGTFVIWAPLVTLQAVGIGDVAVPTELSAIMGTLILGKALKDAFKKS